MLIKQEEEFQYGYNSITEMNGKHQEMLMDISLLRMKRDQSEESNEKKERAYLLIQGEVKLEWGEGNTKTIKRDSCFTDNPWCLHLPEEMKVVITALKESELMVQKTTNDNSFDAKLYTPEESRSEQFGKDVLGNVSLRTVRTIFDDSNAPYSNLVIGEVINHSGKWSSYPPHHHPEPEVYYYRFEKEQGFGYSRVGDDVNIVNNNDTVTIPGGLVHPQVAAPGYPMYYCWMIRHLADSRFNERIFVPEHKWLLDEK